MLSQYPTQLLVYLSDVLDSVLSAHPRQIPHHQRALLKTECPYLIHDTLQQFFTQICLRSHADQGFQHVYPPLEMILRQMGLNVLKKTDPTMVLFTELLSAEFQQKVLKLTRSKGQSTTVIVLEDRLCLTPHPLLDLCERSDRAHDEKHRGYYYSELNLTKHQTNPRNYHIKYTLRKTIHFSL